MTDNPFAADEPTPEITAFFAAHAEAWSAFDADAVAAGYASPIAIRTDARTSFIESDDEAVAMVTAHMERARANGVATATIERLAMKALPDDAARVLATWVQSDAAGAVLVRFPAVYTLAAEDGAWSIVAIDAQGEVDAWAGAGWA